ncbi:MAG: hypothetical protein ACTSYI_10045 [Promethearchaeota archaeon]
MGSNNSSTESNPPPTISCPECQNRLNPELVSFLLNGQTVYCEVCGFPFYAIEDGEVKPLEKKNNYSYSQKSLTKDEAQWIAWKKEWQKVKSQIKTEFSTAFSGVFSKKSKHEKHEKQERQGETQKFEKSTQGFESSSPSYTHTPAPSPIPTSRPIHSPAPPIKPKDQEIVKNLHTAKSVLVELSPFYYAFIIIITFFTSLSSGSWFNFLGALLIEFFIVIYDHKVFLPHDKENRVSHAGIPMIIFGLFSLGGYGIGVFLLARGILNLLLFLKEAQAISSTHPVLVDNPMSRAIWTREILYSFIPYVFELFIVFLLAGVLKDLGTYVQHRQELGSFLYALIAGGIVVVLIYRLILPALRSNPIEKFPTDKAIILIVCGVLSLSTVAGLFFIIIGILILSLQRIGQTTISNLPDVRDIREISNSLVINGINPEENEKEYPQTPAPIIQKPIIYPRKIVKPITKKHIIKKQKIILPEVRKPRKRFDPQTGAPLTQNGAQGPKNQNKPVKLSPSENFNDLGVLSQQNIRVVPDPGEITDMIFTVLHQSIRKRLINMSITENEKDNLAKSFLYLTLEEQTRFMSELEQVNTSHYDYYAEYIKRIQGLPIAKDQQDFLIQQLNYLPDGEIEEYLRVLENLS